MIDHLVYGAPDLDTAVDALERRFGVRAAPGGKHVGIGTHNALLGLGARTYLEVIAPDPDQPPPASARPFGIDELSSPRLVGWAIGCDDIDRAIATSRAAGYDPGDAIEMTRAAPNGTVLRWWLTLNALAGGPVPFLIAWGDTQHPAIAAPHGLQLDALEIEHPGPESLAATLRALGAEADIKPVESVALVAHIRGRRGMEVLR
jgi:hypothetical protein